MINDAGLLTGCSGTSVPGGLTERSRTEKRGVSETAKANRDEGFPNHSEVESTRESTYKDQHGLSAMYKEQQRDHTYVLSRNAFLANYLYPPTPELAEGISAC